MKRSASRVLSALLSLMVFSSGCSIKEERDVCPCRLFLDLQSLDKLDQTPFLLGVMSDDGFEYTTVIDCDDFQDTYVLDVPRTDLDIVVWSGGGDCMHQQGLTIPLGSGCPPVYIYSRRLAAYGEAVYDTVFLNKNYCILNVSVENTDDIRGMMIRGEVAGYDRIGNPDHGDFRIDSRTDSSAAGSYSFYLPRQDDARLYLDYITILSRYIEVGVEDFFDKNYVERHNEMLNDGVTHYTWEEERDYKYIAEELAWIDREDNGYFIRIPKTIEEFRREGEMQHICIFALRYFEFVIEHSSIIVFLRKEKDTPYVTIEYDYRTFKVVQAHGKSNADVEPELYQYIVDLGKKLYHERLFHG
jgi:hypothetical protein